MKVTIKALGGATRRTKNRIRENGPVFIVRQKTTPVCFNGRQAVSVDSVPQTDRKVWQGWLPCDEIEIIHTENRDE